MSSSAELNSVESKIRLAALGLPADADDESGDGSCRTVEPTWILALFSWKHQPPGRRHPLPFSRSPHAALRCLAPLPLQPALDARVLADGDVEPHPRRAPEMWTEDGAGREH